MPNLTPKSGQIVEGKQLGDRYLLWKHVISRYFHTIPENQSPLRSWKCNPASKYPLSSWRQGSCNPHPSSLFSCSKEFISLTSIIYLPPGSRSLWSLHVKARNMSEMSWRTYTHFYLNQSSSHRWWTSSHSDRSCRAWGRWCGGTRWLDADNDNIWVLHYYNITSTKWGEYLAECRGLVLVIGHIISRQNVL